MSIDTQAEQTTLDKEATIIIGNDLREGAEYRLAFSQAQKLNDSLIKETGLLRTQVADLKQLTSTYKGIIAEKDSQLTLYGERVQLREEEITFLEKQNKAKWWSGLKMGVALSAIIGAITAILIGI